MNISVIRKYCPRSIRVLVKKIYNYIISIIKYTIFIIDFISKKETLSDKRFQVLWRDRLACLNDNTKTTGFDAHYVYHTAWAIRQIKEFSPKHHIDIGSYLYFVTAISAYIPTTFYDYRPAHISISNLETKSGNLLSLNFDNNSIESISCLHVIEHIGLERYGDPFDAKGDLKAISELKRVIKPGGRLFLAIPMGEVSRIQYNAHRIYSYEAFISNFPDFTLINFSFITDSGEFIESAIPQYTYKSSCGCGCFTLQKK